MPDVLEAPLVAAKSLEDGAYGAASAARSPLRLAGLSLGPWTWSLGSSMSGGVETVTSPRGGLHRSLATNSVHHPHTFAAESEGSAAAGHYSHYSHSRARQYFHVPAGRHQEALQSSSSAGGAETRSPTSSLLHSTTNTSTSTNSTSTKATPQAGRRQHLSNLENLTHHRRHHHTHGLLSRPGAATSGHHNKNHGPPGGVSNSKSGSGRCAAGSSAPLASPTATNMRANERWVLLNKETFQEIFDATLHQMTFAPGELVDGHHHDDHDQKSTSPSSSERGAASPASPTTPEGLRWKGAASLCHTTIGGGGRKRTLSEAREEDMEAEAAALRSAAAFRQASSPLTAMAPTESAKTSGINNHRHSPAVSSSSTGSSAPPSPRLTSPPGAHMTSQHSPPRLLAPPVNEGSEQPLDLSIPSKKPADISDNHRHLRDNSSSQQCTNNPYSKDVTVSDIGPSPVSHSPATTNTSLHDRISSSHGVPTTTTTVTADGHRTTSPTLQQPSAAVPAAPTHSQSGVGEIVGQQQQQQSAPLEGGSIRTAADGSSGGSAPVDPRALSPPRGGGGGGGGSREGVGRGVAAGGQSSRQQQQRQQRREVVVGEEKAVVAGDAESEPTVQVEEEDAEHSSTTTTTTTTPSSPRNADQHSDGLTPSANTECSTQSSGVEGGEVRSSVSSSTPQQSCETSQQRQKGESSGSSTPSSPAGSPGHSGITTGDYHSDTTKDSEKPSAENPRHKQQRDTPSPPSGEPAHQHAARMNDSAAAHTTSGTSTQSTSCHRTSRPASGGSMKPAASENWVPLNKDKVYDLVEEVMFSLRDEEEDEARNKVSSNSSTGNNNNNNTLRDSSNHKSKTSALLSTATHQLQQQQQQHAQSASSNKSRTVQSNNINNNVNVLKRPHSEVDVGSSGSSHSGGHHHNHQHHAGSGRSSRHRCSPPLPHQERCTSNQGHTQEEDMQSSGRSTVPSCLPRSVVVSSTKSQLRDHLSARQATAACTNNNNNNSKALPPSSRVPNPHPEHSLQEKVTRSAMLSNQQSQNRCSPLRPIGNMGKFTPSSTTSPTSKTKEQQCWIGINKNLVYNIVESAMRNSETEDEENEEGENLAESRMREINSANLNTGDNNSNKHDPSGAESAKNSIHSNNQSSSRDSSNGENHGNASKYTCESASRKRSCSSPSLPSSPPGGRSPHHNLEDVFSSTKRNRLSPHPSSPTTTTTTTTHDHYIYPDQQLEAHHNHHHQTTRRTCLEGLLSESGGRRSPQQAVRGKSAHLSSSSSSSGGGSRVGSPRDGATSNSSQQLQQQQQHRRDSPMADGESSGSETKVRKSSASVHLDAGQVAAYGRIDVSRNAGKLPQREGTAHAQSTGRPSPCSAAPNSGKNQLSAAQPQPIQGRGGCTATTGKQDVRSGIGSHNTSDADSMTNTKHGLAPVPVSKHGLLPVSPSATDARSSPRLGWVAVSKIDVHNIVDSVVDSMIGVSELLSSATGRASPLAPGEEHFDDCDDRRAAYKTSGSTSPVPSSPLPQQPPKSPSMSSSSTSNSPVVTSPRAARDAESCTRRATSPSTYTGTKNSSVESPLPPHSPTNTSCSDSGSSSCIVPPQGKDDTRSTPSPSPPSPTSPRSPGSSDLNDRSADAKSTSSKAFKWKSSLLMRVEEEKIDVTAEVTNTTASGRTGSTQHAQHGRVSANSKSRKSDSRSLRSSKKGSRKGGGNSASKLK